MLEAGKGLELACGWTVERASRMVSLRNNN